jgi:hypothetical protein
VAAGKASTKVVALAGRAKAAVASKAVAPRKAAENGRAVKNILSPLIATVDRRLCREG